jgi:hypothetical protein
MTQVVGPDPIALIPIRDRFAAHAEALRPGPDGAFVAIYTIGPDPRHFASSRAAIAERNIRAGTRELRVGSVYSSIP